MIGSDKEIAFAEKILRGVRSYYIRRIEQEPRSRAYFEGRLSAIDLIEAIDAGRRDEALRLVETADIPGWVTGTYVIARKTGDAGWSRDEPESLEDAVVVAAHLIDALKADFDAARREGLC